jgi:hypothetical protein
MAPSFLRSTVCQSTGFRSAILPHFLAQVDTTINIKKLGVKSKHLYEIIPGKLATRQDKLLPKLANSRSNKDRF